MHKLKLFLIYFNKTCVHFQSKKVVAKILLPSGVIPDLAAQYDNHTIEKEAFKDSQIEKISIPQHVKKIRKNLNKLNFIEIQSFRKLICLHSNHAMILVLLFHLK